MAKKKIRLTWVKEKEWGYDKAMRVVESNHPRFLVGSRFDWGFASIATEAGYSLEIEAVPADVMAYVHKAREARAHG